MSYRFTRSHTAGAIHPSPVFLLIVAIAVGGGVLAWVSDVWSAPARVGVFVLVVAGWIVSVCLHEFGHAYTAWRAGDREIEARGYLTLNPLKYSHPVLSIGLPILFIAMGGFALPGGAVYIRPEGFSAKTRRIISGAGPAVNAVCAVVLLATVRFGAPEQLHRAGGHAAFWFGLTFLGFLQVTATVLNLIPIPGTDGYGILEPSLSYQTRRSLDQVKPYGFLLLFAILIGVPPLRDAFYSLVYRLFDLSGLNPNWIAYGFDHVAFWQPLY
ncbi:site-2 protease family protein [Nocardia stercoris]|uniref:Site-2 protease family protein n=1 Tax=Nocardia stercoris TaxID=2483361 RepID=A0A3M2L4B2_9NOCA|nr:site-2 protease family protein [Nocardia stercoris]RMI29348.1 site-2 protease family protein [Nocardia stercoris]